MKSLIINIILIFSLSNFIHANILKDINSTIPHLDTKNFDPIYYKHKLINNIPFQQNRINKKFFFNPLYVAYYLRDYYYKLQSGEQVYKKNIDELLNAVMNRSSVFTYKGMKVRVFYYEPSGDVLRMFHKHFSALTQAQFVNALTKIYSYTNDEKYYNLAKEFANSFFVKIEDNGILYDNNNITSFAEVPTVPHGQTLNGWLAALVYLEKSNKILKDKKLTELLIKNITTLDKVIELYDIPEQFNSRYNLSQFYYFRLLNKSKQEIKIKKIILEYSSGEKDIIMPNNLNLKIKKSRWENYILDKYNLNNNGSVISIDKILQLNVVMSRLGYPKENKIIFEFEDSISSPLDKLQLEIYDTQYNPFYSGPINGKWKNINKYTKKNNTLEFSIPYNYLDALGNGTNFIKKFKDGNKNVYHDVHISWLIYLGLKYNKKHLLDTANKWLNYKTGLFNNQIHKDTFKNKNIILDKYTYSEAIKNNKLQLTYLKYLVNLASNKIKYGNANNKFYFYDEVINFKEGHCGHYTRILANLLTNNMYFNYEIVSIITFNHRSHALMQIDLDGKKYVLDPTNNVIYPNSAEELIQNPELTNNRIGECKHLAYCDEGFWGTVKKLEYFPYLKYKNLNSEIQDTSSSKLTDMRYNTYKGFNKGNTKLDFKLNNPHRLSSIVIYAYDTKSNKSIDIAKIICMQNQANLLLKNISAVKNKTMTIINIPSGLECNKISLEINSKNKYFIRDIEINGK